MKYFFFLIIVVFLSSAYAQTNTASKTKEKLSPQSTTLESQTITKEINTSPIVPASKERTIEPLKPSSEVFSTPVDAETTNQINERSISSEKPLTEEIIVEKPNGTINWSQQYIEAKGQSAIDYDRFKNKAQARLMATRGAIVIAQRNLLEIVKGVEIVGETKVEDMITTNDYVYSKVEGVVKGAKQIGTAIERDGVIEVTVRMPIYSNKGIASVFSDKEVQQAHLKNGYKSNLMPQDETISGNLDPNKPLIFTLNGKKIDLSLFPVIVDDNNNVQFDFSKLINTKTGEFPKYLQLTKDIMKDLGYDKGMNVIELIQSGKGEFKLPKKANGAFWKTVGNIAKTTGKILFNIPFK